MRNLVKLVYSVGKSCLHWFRFFLRVMVTNWFLIIKRYWKFDGIGNAVRTYFRSFVVHTIHLFCAIENLFVNTNVYIFCQQQQCTAVTPFRLQVFDTATVIPARDYLLVQKTQIPAVIVTASQIKYRHIPSSLRG